MNTARRFSQNVPGSASGPQPVGEPAAGFHTAGAPVGGPAGVIPSAAGAGAFLTTEWRLLLISLSILGIVWAFTGCTVATGNRNAGTYTYASLAGNASFGEMGPEGMRNAVIDNATGAGVARDLAEKIGRAYAWGKFWDFASDGLTEISDVVSDNNETDVQINKSNNATQQAVETFVPPEPVVP